jgi:hypothetical protein
MVETLTPRRMPTADHTTVQLILRCTQQWVLQDIEAVCVRAVCAQRSGSLCTGVTEVTEAVYAQGSGSLCTGVTEVTEAVFRHL